MTRLESFAIVLAVVILGVALIASKVLDARDIKALKVTGDSLRLHIAATDVRLDAFTSDSANFVAFRDSSEAVSASLRADLRRTRGRGRVVSASLDSARLRVQIDTLAPVLRGMILLEREMAQSFMQERDLERELRLSVETQLEAFRSRLAAAEALIFTLRGERDSAMVLVSRHEARLEFNLFRWFGEEIPQMLACAGGGAIVATINDGDLLISAGIGLAACLVKEAVF